MSSKQRRLLFSAVHTLLPGGVLVYSTCTFAPEENEAMIDWALNKFEGALQVDAIQMDLPNTAPPLTEWEGRTYDPAVQRSLRILPDGLYEGFYVCRLTKTASTMRGRT